MKATYETCGTFDLFHQTATGKLCLPDVKNAGYEFYKYYNISNEHGFGIFGLFHDALGNTSLLEREEAKTSFKIQPEIHFNQVNNDYCDVYLRDLDESSDLYLFCWHEINFDESFLQKILTNKYTMEEVLELVQNGGLKNEAVEDENEENKALMIPKVGNGGILTVDGSC